MKSHSLIWGVNRLVVIFLVLATVAIPSQANAAPNNTPVLPGPPTIVKIGLIYPFTGPLDYWGQEGEPFWRQAQTDINHLPETMAKNIEFQLLVRPSGSTGTGALLAAQDLVYNEHVQAIVGLPTSPELSGAISFLTTENIAVISSTSTGTEPALRQPDKVFRIMPNELYLARNMADMVVQRGFNKVAIIHSTSDWGKDYSDELRNHLLAKGCVTQSIAVPPLSPPSAGNYALEVQNLAAKVDALGPGTAIVMVVAEGDDLIILNHARNYPNLNVPWFSAMAGPELLTGTYAGLNLPDGSIFADSVDLWSQEHYFPRGGLADALLLHAQAFLGRKPRAEHVYVYDAVQLMARAILLSKNYFGAGIAAEIPTAATSYVPATGPIFFDGNGDRDSGDLAYTCMVPTGSPPYEYDYSAFFHGNSLSGFFDMLPAPQLRDLVWLR